VLAVLHLLELDLADAEEKLDATSSASASASSTPEDGVAVSFSYLEIAVWLMPARSAKARRDSPATLRASFMRCPIIARSSLACLQLLHNKCDFEN
jgi:hypothetical protein